MSNWICENKQCSYFLKNKKAWTESVPSNPSKKDVAPVKCKWCKKIMVENKSLVVVEVSPFDKWCEAVKTAVGPSFAASYQKKVIDFLKGKDGQSFQDDFIDEMKKETDLNKFSKNLPPRSTEKFTICFDNAITQAGFDLPDKCPKGEKYDFEIPYIMSAIQWSQMAFCKGKPIYTEQFSTFVKNAKGGFSYMLATRNSKTALIGHMIFVYFDKGKTHGWIHDPQKLKLNYWNHYCIVWESPKECGGEETPGCSFSLTDGKCEEFVD